MKLSLHKPGKCPAKKKNKQWKNKSKGSGKERKQSQDLVLTTDRT